jgi:anti-sigma B factor antagonist
MNLTIRKLEDQMVLALSGRFDVYTVTNVLSWLEENTNQPPAKVVIDLTNVHFVDSSALAALVKGMKRCRQQGGDLYLCGLQKPVHTIFELTRLDKAFRIFTDEGEALKAFSAS